MIEISNIKKAFNQGKPNEYWALNGIDLTLEAGLRLESSTIGQSGWMGMWGR